MKISGICGSLRKNSWNNILLKIVLNKIAKNKKINTEIINVSNFPLYNADIESIKTPEDVIQAKSKIQKSDSTAVIAPYGQKLSKDDMKAAKKFAKKDVPYQDSKGGHTLEVDKGKVRNLTKILRGEKQTKSEHYDWRSTLDEKCWAGYEKKGMKTMFGKRYPNCVKKSKKKK